MAIADHGDCMRYEIKVTRRIFNGKETEKIGHFVYPPVNGTESSMGDVCNDVFKIGKAS